MFYLTYRPQTVSEIDTILVRERLVSLLKSNTISHAFLLVGPKGTGKTSTARILAKAINCENNSFAKKGKDFEPCNHCQTCISITQGSSLDIIEMDGASNRRIDDIRELLTQIKFSPLQARYKVYIIDEVHMLTTESFNALLKTLEEPPRHTIFILATTEEEKLPKTIISRCVTLRFTKAKISEIVESLKRVCKGEKITASDEVLQLIAHHSDNSFRDAHKLLEEITEHGKIITLSVAQTVLGLSSAHTELLRFIDKKNEKDIIAFLESFDKKGGSSKALIETMLSTLHELLMFQKGIQNPSEKISDYSFSTPEIISLMRLLQDAYRQLKYTPIEILPLEIALIEYFAQKK